MAATREDALEAMALAFATAMPTKIYRVAKARLATACQEQLAAAFPAASAPEIEMVALAKALGKVAAYLLRGHEDA